MNSNSLNLSNSYEAVNGAYRALSFIEQLENCLNGLNYVSESLPLEVKTELDIYIDKLRILISLVDDNPTESGIPELLAGAKLSLKNFNPTVIERLGIASQIIRLRQVDQLNYTQIANRLNISVSSVKRFLTYYDQAPLSTRAQYQRASIFDTSSQYEEIGTMIYRQLARLENEPEHHVKYISELRQLLKSAHDWMDKLQSHNEMAEVKETVIEILSSCLPEQREEIIKRFNSIGFKGLKSAGFIQGY
jgi:hypothetical protein